MDVSCQAYSYQSGECVADYPQFQAAEELTWKNGQLQGQLRYGTPGFRTIAQASGKSTHGKYRRGKCPVITVVPEHRGSNRCGIESPGPAFNPIFRRSTALRGTLIIRGRNATQCCPAEQYGTEITRAPGGIAPASVTVAVPADPPYPPGYGFAVFIRINRPQSKNRDGGGQSTAGKTSLPAVAIRHIPQQLLPELPETLLTPRNHRKHSH